MKYIITENTLKSSIERYLMSSFPEIISVDFKSKKVLLASDNDRIITRQVIDIVADPYNVRGGNKKFVYAEAKQLKSRIWNSIDTMFSLGFENYGSEWEMKFSVIKLEEM